MQITPSRLFAEYFNCDPRDALGKGYRTSLAPIALSDVDSAFRYVLRNREPLRFTLDMINGHKIRYLVWPTIVDEAEKIVMVAQPILPPKPFR